MEDPQFMLGVISGKLDLVLVNQAEAARAAEARFAKVEGRLDALEDGQAGYQRDRSWLFGGAAAIGAGLSGFATWLGLR